VGWQTPPVPSRKAIGLPASLEVPLPALCSGRSDDLGTDADVEGIAFDGLDLQGLVADGARLLECRLSSCKLDDARLRRARLSSCLLQDVSATALDMADSSWLDVVVRGGRVGAFVAHGASLTRVAFVGARVDYINLRAATLTQVRLLDCRIGELDLCAAQVKTVRFEGCEVERLVVTGASLEAVDLAGADLVALEGVGSLRGAEISQDQLTRLLPALAAHLGIEVHEPP
jgi:uncharacterized protein YjbI with pentapeptide repeats